MASIAEFTLPADGFPLGRIFEDNPAITLELDRIVPTDDTVMPYFWVHRRGADRSLAEMAAAFDGLPELRSATLMEDLENDGLFRAEWDPDELGIMSAIAETEVTVLSASGSSEGWTFELRADSNDRFSAFHRYCADIGVDVTLARLSRLSEATPGVEYDLTPEQYEALVRAYRGGYYEDSRGTDQKTLAAELGISRQAFASRLRRGYRNLIRNTLDVKDGDA